MAIKAHDTIDTLNIPGLSHQTLAGAKDGLKGLEIWRQTIEAGGETPLHKHDCEEVIVILEGEGACVVEGDTQTFRADQSVIVEPNVVHKICNTGSGPLRLMATLAMAPVRVETPDGEAMALPWD
jgi:mannose-6-phosphate isomerase-like protein (cupin superfamily)